MTAPRCVLKAPTSAADTAARDGPQPLAVQKNVRDLAVSTRATHECCAKVQRLAAAIRCCKLSLMETPHSTGVPAPQRKSITLTARDLADLAMIRNSPQAQQAVGATESMSEAALLHALVTHSLQLAREAAEEAAYAELAIDPEEQAIRAALRARGRRSAASDAE